MAENLAANFTVSDLPSVKFYETLEKDSMQLQYKVPIFCRGFHAMYDKELKIKNLCSKYVTYLNKRDSILRKYTNKHDYCNLISYWVSNELLETHKVNQNDSISAFKQMELMWKALFRQQRKDNSYVCVPYNSIINFYDDWKNSKILYDYYIDFDVLNKMTYNCAGKCHEICYYLEAINTIYKSFNEICTSNVTNKCPISIMDYNARNPLPLLGKYKCRTEHKDLDMDEAQARLEETEGNTDTELIPETEGIIDTELNSERELPSYTPSITMSSEGTSELLIDESNHISKFGNTLLG
ncbi:variable surface protein, partial [Plasmodium gonderi]